MNTAKIRRTIVDYMMRQAAAERKARRAELAIENAQIDVDGYRTLAKIFESRIKQLTEVKGTKCLT